MSTAQRHSQENIWKS